MLYPLSYEGLPVHLPSVWAVFRSIGLGLDTSCPMACAASVPRAVGPGSAPPSQHAAPIVRMVMPGHLCRDGCGRERTRMAGVAARAMINGLTRVDVNCAHSVEE
jgi:hypothetical protein